MASELNNYDSRNRYLDRPQLESLPPLIARVHCQLLKSTQSMGEKLSVQTGSISRAHKSLLSSIFHVCKINNKITHPDNSHTFLVHVSG